MGSSLLGMISPSTEMLAPLRVVILASWRFVAIVFSQLLRRVVNRIVFFDRTIPVDKWSKENRRGANVDRFCRENLVILLKAHIPGRWALTAWTRSVPGP